MYCDTGKICFNTKNEAIEQFATQRRRFRFYKCVVCGFFHASTIKKKRRIFSNKKGKDGKYPLKYTWPVKEDKK